LAAGILAGAVWLGLVSGATAPPSIRIGATLAPTGVYATLGQNQLRGYQLCVKHANERGGVLGRKLELQGGSGARPVRVPHQRSRG
jgi:ABC-type branched-subunit amino acid transport system substrate-binding protein